ncbi:MAG: diguanylate cyclase [Candidatus Hydrogenedentes bacterium]|nr:diguanylate cyclase [Candidatus Hydrogenedentota bacterium]
MQQFRVCVADDDEPAATVLCEGLKLNNYDAFAVYTGADALDACRKGGVDLLLLDVCFPDISGFEVIKSLKESSLTRDIAVIFVSAKGSEADILTGYQLGAVDYITKPYNLPMVMVRVEAAIRARNVTQRLTPADEILCDSAYTDHLTGLRNRRFLLERLQEEVEEAHRYDYPVSCVVFDVDEVRAVDEELGPVSLDDLLVELAMSLRNHSRTFDVLARYDGTLFAVVLPHTPMEQAVSYASKILHEMDSTTFSDPSFPTEVRMSAGIVSCQNGSALSADRVLGQAMRGLLEAKGKRSDRLVACNLSQE